MVPVATGLINYGYHDGSDFSYPLVLSAFLFAFNLGALLGKLPFGAGGFRPSRGDLDVSVPASHMTFVWLAWMAAVVGTTCLVIDFAFLEGAGLDDLASLRDLYIVKEATIFAKLGSILTWGCLYCFIFSVLYRREIGGLRFVILSMPIVGFFLVAVFSAGRQAALQIALVAILVFALGRARTVGRKSSVRAWLPVLMISMAMVSYMGYVALARNDGNVSSDKVEVLLRLFDARLSDWGQGLVDATGVGLRATLVEGLIYFSSPIALFEKFLSVDIPQHFFGAMSFPLIFRQIEALTGISVIGALDSKIELMRSVGVIGAGWTTGISSYIHDFGHPGALLFLFFQGFLAEKTWKAALRKRDLNGDIIAIVLMISILYLPLLAATGDTNLLLLLVYALLARSAVTAMSSTRPLEIGGQARSIQVIRDGIPQ